MKALLEQNMDSLVEEAKARLTVIPITEFLTNFDFAVLWETVNGILTDIFAGTKFIKSIETTERTFIIRIFDMLTKEYRAFDVQFRNPDVFFPGTWDIFLNTGAETFQALYRQYGKQEFIQQIKKLFPKQVQAAYAFLKTKGLTDLGFACRKTNVSSLNFVINFWRLCKWYDIPVKIRGRYVFGNQFGYLNALTASADLSNFTNDDRMCAVTLLKQIYMTGFVNPEIAIRENSMDGPLITINQDELPNYQNPIIIGYRVTVRTRSIFRSISDRTVTLVGRQKIITISEEKFLEKKKKIEDLIKQLS